LKKMPEKKRTPSLKSVIELVNKEFGEGSMIVPDITGYDEEVEVISTGSRAIDNALGIGGIPRGRITEVMGKEGGGKTTLVLHVIANAQKEGLQCAIIDTEHALDRSRAEAIGVDFGKLAISQPDNGEQALDLLDFLVRSKRFQVIAVDSVAALTPKAEIEGDMSDANIGVMARNMGKAMRRITAPAHKYNVCVMFTNQIRDKIGGFGFGPQETTPGGNALKFYASVRIDTRRTQNKMTGSKLAYTIHKVKITKNKLAPPMQVVNVHIGPNGFINEE
jgi:recombination protein RecA